MNFFHPSILSGLRITRLLPLLLTDTAMAYTPTEEDSTAINTMLSDLCSKAVEHQTNDFLAYFSRDYLHNGTTYDEWRNDVFGNFASVSACLFEIRSIDMIDATTAKVSGMLKITLNGETSLTPQPDYNQDNPGIGWLKKEGSSWKVIGNGFHATWNGVFTGNNVSGGNRFLRVRVENENSPVTSASVNGPGISNTDLFADPELGGNIAYLNPSTLPAVGTIYTIQASYQDGTSDTISFPIQSWVDVAPNINVSGGGSQMTISWDDISDQVPLASSYRVTVYGDDGVYWAKDDIPLDTLEVNFNEDGTASGTLSPGENYTVEVMIFDAYDNYAYRYAFHTQSASAPPANDTFASATDLGSSATASSTGDWTNASSEAGLGEPDLEENGYYGWWQPEDATLWYKWTAPDDANWAQVNISNVTNVVNTLAIYTGDSINNLTQVRLNQRVLRYETRDGNDGNMAPNRVTFPVIPGQTYYIRPSVGNTRYDEIASLENPDYTFDLQLTSITTPTTADEYVLRGRGKLENGSKADVASAKADFQQAYTLTPTHSEARFLFALAQLLSLENETGFTTLLGQLGVTDTTGSFRTTGYHIPTDLAGNPVFASGANSSQVIDWLKNSVLPRLADVRTSLTSITDTNFATDLTRSESGMEDVAIDLADAKMLKTTTHGLDLLVNFLTTYNLTIPLQNLQTLDTDGQLDAEHVLATYQQLLKFSATDGRQGMADAIRSLQTDYLDASTTVTSLRNSAPNTVAGTVCENLDSVQDTEFRSDLSTAANGLTQQISIGGHSYQFSNFLSTPKSLRDWLPTMRGNDASSAVPDPTFSGIVPSSTAQDVEGNLYEIGRLYGMSQYANEVGGYLEWLGLDDRPGDDADHDGKSNFSEWIFASDPGNAAESEVQTSVSRVATTPGQPDEIRFSFLRSIYLSDWDLVVEVSEDLVNWDASGDKVEFITATPTGDTYSELATYRLKPQTTPPNRQYFRAVAKPRVTTPPAE